METNDKQGWKKLKTTYKPGVQASSGEEENQDKPGANHSLHDHTAGAEGSATSTHEPTLRGATTDSSRVPKNENDERPTGGNVR